VPDRGLDHGQAARREQSGAGALENPGGHELVGGDRHRAQQRADREPRHADDEDAAAAVPVTQGTADQDQRGEGEQVAVGDPLQLLEAGVEVGSDPA
jgi:hypothetical protein